MIRQNISPLKILIFKNLEVAELRKFFRTFINGGNCGFYSLCFSLIFPFLKAYWS